AGGYTFAENTLTLLDNPPIGELAGTLHFTQDDVQLRDAQGRMFGRPMWLTITSEAGGIVRVQGAGQIDAAGLRRWVSPPMLGRFDGTTDWKVTALVQEHHRQLVIDSSLAGLSSTLPAPLNKAASQRMPLHLERREAGPAQDLCAFTVGNVLSGQLLVDRSTKFRVTQGELSLSDRAPAPKREGVWISGQVDRLDLDQLKELLSGTSGADDGVAWAGLNVSARHVRMFSRNFTDMQIDALRKGPIWVTKLDGPQVAGEVE